MIVLYRDRHSPRYENNPRNRGKYVTTHPLLERTLTCLLSPSLIQKITTMNSGSQYLAAVPTEYFSFLSSLIPAAYGSHVDRRDATAQIGELNHRLLVLLSSHVSSERTASSPPDVILGGLLECIRSTLSLCPSVFNQFLFEF